MTNHRYAQSPIDCARALAKMADVISRTNTFINQAHFTTTRGLTAEEQLQDIVERIEELKRFLEIKGCLGV